MIRTHPGPEDPAHDQESESDEADDDEIEVIKANIFKYQGDLTYDQEVSQDIMHFEYYDDFSDDVDDVVIIEEDDPELNESENLEASLNEAQNTFVCCEECGDLFAAAELEEHRESKHPPKKKNIKEFADGNFFMLAE